MNTSASYEVDRRAKSYSEQRNVEYADAVRHVLEEDPELRQAYEFRDVGAAKDTGEGDALHRLAQLVAGLARGHG